MMLWVYDQLLISITQQPPVFELYVGDLLRKHV